MNNSANDSGSQGDTQHGCLTFILVTAGSIGAAVAIAYLAKAVIGF